MHVLAWLSESLFPFPLRVWVSQAVLAFHTFGVCEQVYVCAYVSARLCVRVYTCVRVQGVGWVMWGREQLFHFEQQHSPHLTASHPRKQPDPGAPKEQSQRPDLRCTPFWLSMLFSLYYEACGLAQGASEITFLKGSYQQTAKRRKFFLFVCLFSGWTRRLVGS